MLRNELIAWLDGVLEPWRFHDYCPNGLQVEGRDDVGRVVCGVTASQALIDAAVARKADALLVHHGWFWKGEDSRVTGLRKRRLQTLLAHDISLIAYHLPLDAHLELGNNARLAALMGWTVTGHFAEQNIGFIGTPTASGDSVSSASTFTVSAQDIARQLARVLGREPLLVGDTGKPLRRIAWCSGGAQSYFEEAIQAGAEIFISGEISEPTVHLAREFGVPYLAAGHHATERYGIQALGERLAAECGIDCEFIDIDNPV